MLHPNFKGTPEQFLASFVIPEVMAYCLIRYSDPNERSEAFMRAARALGAAA